MSQLQIQRIHELAEAVRRLTLSLFPVFFSAVAFLPRSSTTMTLAIITATTQRQLLHFTSTRCAGRQTFFHESKDLPFAFSVPIWFTDNPFVVFEKNRISRIRIHTGMTDALDMTIDSRHRK